MRGGKKEEEEEENGKNPFRPRKLIFKPKCVVALLHFQVDAKKILHFPLPDGEKKTQIQYVLPLPFAFGQWNSLSLILTPQYFFLGFLFPFH